MFEVHEEGDNVIGFYYGKRDEKKYKYVVWYRSESNTYFKNGDAKQNPECFPDDLHVVWNLMFLDKLIVNITGVISFRVIAVVMRLVRHILNN